MWTSLPSKDLTSVVASSRDYYLRRSPYVARHDLFAEKANANVLTCSSGKTCLSAPSVLLHASNKSNSRSGDYGEGGKRVVVVKAKHVVQAYSEVRRLTAYYPTPYYRE